MINDRPRFKEGWYKGYYCQSSWELIYVVYALDVIQQKITRNAEKFPYPWKGNTEQYIPDFILEDGSYIEIKGKFTDKEFAKWKSFRETHGKQLLVFGEDVIVSMLAEIKDSGKFQFEKIEELFEPKRDSVIVSVKEQVSELDKEIIPEIVKPKAAFFAFDTETGGLDPTHTSLLTFAGLILDKDLEILDEICFSLKDDSGGEPIFHLSAYALKVNKIDLQAHSKEAIGYSLAGQMLNQKLAYWCENGSKFPKRLYGMGQNVSFDYAFIKQLGKHNYDKYLAGGSIDLYNLSIMFQAAGKLPASMKLNLESMVKYFGIKCECHNAREDIIATVKILKILLNTTKEVFPMLNSTLFQKIEQGSVTK